MTVARIDRSDAQPLPPLTGRQTPAFDRMVEIHRDDSMVPRLISQYLGNPRFGRRAVSLGLLRCALAWDALPGFLAENDWQVEGSCGVRHGDDYSIPELGALRLSERLVLEYPSNVVLFLERDGERRVLQFELEQGGRGAQVGIRLAEPRRDVASFELVEAWFEYARHHCRLRGQNLRASGALAGERGLRPGERLFLSPESRRAVELVERRFAAATAEA